MTPEQNDKLRHTLSAVLSLPADRISDDTSPDNVPAWDSVMHLNLVLALEETFATSFTPEETLEMMSVRLIGQVLGRKNL